MKPEDVATPRWHQDLSRDPRMMSALAWAIANGHTPTAQYAGKVARSMGKLPSYMLDVHFYQGLLPDACRPWRNRWEKLRDALVPESPWAARIRSQLVEPPGGHSTTPPLRYWHVCTPDDSGKPGLGANIPSPGRRGNIRPFGRPGSPSCHQEVQLPPVWFITEALVWCITDASRGCRDVFQVLVAFRGTLYLGTDSRGRPRTMSAAAIGQPGAILP